MRPPRTLLVAALACLIAGAGPAYGKGDVRATLENAAALRHATPGQRVRITWTLNEAAPLPILTAPGQAAPRPFGAGGVYLRIRGASGTTRNVPAATPRSTASPTGRYSAELTVPPGGIAAIAIGLEGFTGPPGRASTRADIFFPITNDPFARPTTPLNPPSPTPAPSSPPWIAVAAALAALTAVTALAAAASHRRRHTRPTT